jgi:hypothetical protein
VTQLTLPGTVVTSRFELPRDQWGRPKIGGKAYTRASSLSLADKSNLIDWKARTVAQGALLKPELLEQYDDDLRQLAEELSKAGGGSAGSEFGTSVHEAVSEFFLEGVLPADDQIGRCAQSAIDLIEGSFEVLASELTVVDHDRQVAGTLDLLLRSLATGASYIGDVKTSGSNAAMSSKYQGIGWAGQLTAYSRSVPILESLEATTWEALGLPVPNQERAVVIHVHRDSETATLVDVTLDEALIDLAVGVKEARRGAFARPV